ncbi:M28 family metallopeptidase [Thermotalea metallivorans]|uniref:Peptidase M28 domain-containing protein n=1 Tax=Thermotalea metallivorans TaxID=520762 RepID=A0A140L9H7_9FIRM|nr:M28 family peptidase [Thermotalea metallivorans]KXG77202.1 hypothetical protein AN619_07320 [Thermotalea metallivorans]
MLQELTSYERTSREGKEKFIRWVQRMKEEKLNHFELIIEKNQFLWDYKEQIRLILYSFLYVWGIYVCFVSKYSSFFTFVYTGASLFFIQYQMFLTMLPFLYHSKNIILEKKSRRVGNRQVIVCAHYDTVFRDKGCLMIKPLRNFTLSMMRMMMPWLKEAKKITDAVTLLMILKFTADCILTEGLLQMETLWMLMKEWTKISIAGQGGVMAFFILWNYSFKKTDQNPPLDDNTSGLVCALMLAEEINGLDLDDDVKIILFDNEEKGLIGSRHYIRKHKKELKSKETHVINIDCIGRGKDLFVSGCKKEILFQKIIYEVQKNNKGVYWNNYDISDFASFLEENIPAVSLSKCDAVYFMKKPYFPRLDWVHSIEDDRIDLKNVEELKAYILKALLDYS